MPTLFLTYLFAPLREFFEEYIEAALLHIPSALSLYCCLDDSNLFTAFLSTFMKLYKSSIFWVSYFDSRLLLTPNKDLTDPPLAYLFILASLSTPIAWTAFFLITYSPGVSIALTLSLLPDPGTKPPEANPVAPPLIPLLNPLAIEGIPLANPAAPKAASAGTNGFTESATLIRALARSRLNLMNCWNSLVWPMLRIKASNSCCTFDIWTANACWPTAASWAKEPEPLWATLRACWAVVNCWIRGITLPTCLNPPSSSTILLNCKSLGSKLLKPSASLWIATNGPTNFPSRSVNSIPNAFSDSTVSCLWIRLKIVLNPVAIVSALSRVVARTLVNTAINSLRASVPWLTPLLAAANTPPVLWIAAIISLASTANPAATALILPRAFSKSTVLIENCFISAILPSTVWLISLNVGASVVNANDFRACSVCLADNPAWLNVTATSAKDELLAPKLVDKLVIVFDSPSKPALVVPVTCAILVNCLSYSINFSIDCVVALVTA